MHYLVIIKLWLFEADKLSKISYESLLKTLEEVNGNIIIILLVEKVSITKQ